MGWIIFGIVTWAAALLLIQVKYWRKLWLIGLISILFILTIDNTFVSLKAFRFNYSGTLILGLPLPYWLAYFPGGILFAYFRPVRPWTRLGYILAASFVILVIELIMFYFGFFSYINWNPLKSYILNVEGFMTFLWIVEWMSSVMNIPISKS